MYGTKIRKSTKGDIEAIMKIWFSGNWDAHSFIESSYWEGNYKMVKDAILCADVLVYEDHGELIGFIGVVDSYIAGLFVKEKYRSYGIGQKLLDAVKIKSAFLNAHVYLDNRNAVKFYLREDFKVKEKVINEDTGFEEYLIEWSV